ncbi:MAG: PIN domain-containing protein [Ruminococcus sp.]
MGDKKRKKPEKEPKKYYFIDYENVHKTGFNGLLNLSSNDNVIIFYSGNADKITFNLHKEIVDSKADITYFEVKAGGKNALDFQLSTYLGYLIGNKKKARCYIVSNDRGFEFVRDFWKKQGFRIEIISNINDNSPKEETPEKQIQPDNHEDLRKAFKDMNLNKANLDFIISVVESNMKQNSVPLPKRKQNINSELCKKFGNDETKKIYKNLKPFLK